MTIAVIVLSITCIVLFFIILTIAELRENQIWKLTDEHLHEKKGLLDNIVYLNRTIKKLGKEKENLKKINRALRDRPDLAFRTRAIDELVRYTRELEIKLGIRKKEDWNG